MTTFLRMPATFPQSVELAALAHDAGMSLAAALGAVVRLMAWLLVERPDGDVTNLTDTELGLAAGWPGHSAPQFGAAFRAHFTYTETSGDGDVTVTRVRHWCEWWGAQVAERRAAAERAAKYRSGKQKRTTKKRRANVTVTSPRRAVTPPQSDEGGRGECVLDLPGRENSSSAEEQKSEELELLSENMGNGAHRDVTVTGESPAFTLAWNAYPKRLGGNSRADAWKAWKARLMDPKVKVTEVEMLQGTIRYRDYCEGMHMLGTQYVKQGATFYGPGLHFRELYELPPEHQRPKGPAGVKPAPQKFAYTGSTALPGALGDD